MGTTTGDGQAAPTTSPDGADGPPARPPAPEGEVWIVNTTTNHEWMVEEERARELLREIELDGRRTYRMVGQGDPESICGLIVEHQGPKGEPVACAWPPHDQSQPHSWAWMRTNPKGGDDGAKHDGDADRSGASPRQRSGRG